MSFEELLKEFTGDTPPTQTSQEPAQSYEFEQEYPSDDEIQEVYERSIAEADRRETELETDEIEDDRHTGSFQHFRGYSEEDTQEGDNQFGKLLKDADGARKAIILQEILNKKY